MTLSGSGARMGTAVNLFEMLDTDVSVTLRGGEARMAEHLLDRAQVGSGVEHVRREAVAAPVRRDRRTQSRRHDTPGQEIYDPTRRQPPAPPGRGRRAGDVPRRA